MPEKPQDTRPTAVLMVEHLQDIYVDRHIMLPPNPEVGMTWEKTTTYVSGEHRERFAIIRKQDDCLLLETSYSFNDGSTIVYGWLLDPTIRDGNVVSAWIGLPGKRPASRPLSSGYSPSGWYPAAREREVELEIAGKKWTCLYTKEDDYEVWIAKDSFFVLRVRTDSVSSELTDWSDTGASAKMLWP